MRFLLSLALFCGAVARAQGSPDEAAIRKAVAGIDHPCARRPLVVRIRTVMAPTVVISHEPWGEAQIGWPGTPVFEIVRPRIETHAIRLLTAGVALADAACVYDTQTTPLLVILKKEGADWKVVLVRALTVLQ